MKKLLSEPLMHFGIIGLALFLLFSVVNNEESNNEIIIDEYDLNEIVSKWRLQWQRDPSIRELKALLDNYIKEEIFYREALAMNLDHNDEIIRRRMAQKMQFLTQDIAKSETPSDTELLAYLEENQSKYMDEKAISFEHVYFSADRDNAKQDAYNAITSNSAASGDHSPIKSSFIGTSLHRIRAILGNQFAVSLDSLSVTEDWQGPVMSGFGYHLVKITAIVPAKPKTLESAREQVFNDYQYDKQNRLNEELYQSMLEKYVVKIDLDNKELSEASDL